LEAKDLRARTVKRECECVDAESRSEDAAEEDGCG